MKIYVDEFPKDCWDCPMHDGENGWCKMLVCYTDYIPKNCPLHSLADYTKQVRKEIVQEITELAKNQFEFLICDECYNTIDKDVYISSVALTEILDTILKEYRNKL